MDGTLLNKKYKIEERLTALEEGGGGGGYVLPIASASTLGGVKIGDNLEIDEGGVLSASAGLVDYSTTEQATGQKWIDGSTIYCKTYSVGALPSSNNFSFTNDIANFKNVINVEAFGVSSDGYSFAKDGIVMQYCNASTFAFRTSFDATGYDGFITVYYVKNEAQSKKRSTRKKVEE